MKTMKIFYLYKNGERVYRGKTYNDCLVWLHATQSQSWDYAFKYGGYSIKEEEEQV